MVVSFSAEQDDHTTTSIASAATRYKAAGKCSYHGDTSDLNASRGVLHANRNPVHILYTICITHPGTGTGTHGHNHSLLPTN